VCQFEELLEGLKAGMILGEKIGSGGSFAGRSVGVGMIMVTVMMCLGYPRLVRAEERVLK